MESYLVAASLDKEFDKGVLYPHYCLISTSSSMLLTKHWRTYRNESKWEVREYQPFDLQMIKLWYHIGYRTRIANYYGCTAEYRVALKTGPSYHIANILKTP